MCLTLYRLLKTSKILYILWVSQVIQTYSKNGRMSLLGFSGQGYHFTADISSSPTRKLLLSIEGDRCNRRHHHLACLRNHLGEHLEAQHLEGGSLGPLEEVGRRTGVGRRIEVDRRMIGDPFHVGRRLERN